MNGQDKIYQIAFSLGGMIPKAGGGYMALCPTHDDHDPSLAIDVTQDDKILIHCFGGCPQERIITALQEKGLWPKQEPQVTEKYIYLDLDGKMLYWKERIEPGRSGQKKEFISYHGKQQKGRGGRPVLYNLPIITEAETVYVVEGERKADLLVSWALAATTLDSGSNSPWNDEYTKILEGKNIVILPDNDQPGRKYAQNIMGYLLGKANVKIVELPDLQEKGDIIDWANLPGNNPEKFLMIVNGCTVRPDTQALRSSARKTVVSADIMAAVYECLADIESAPINWLWEGRFPKGKISMIAGNPGLGKSQVTLYIAAVVSVGGYWPVNGALCERGNVIILSAEDDAADTIKPRLDALNADLHRIFILTAIRQSKGGDKLFNLRDDLAHLEEMILSIGGVSLIIIDPISAYLGGIDSHKNADVRSLLHPLSDLAAKHRCAIICISHLSKAQNSEVMLRITGSLAFPATARAAYGVFSDKCNENRRLFLPLKNNLAKTQLGLAFELETSSLPNGITTSRVKWEPAFVDIAANEVIATDVSPSERSALRDAKEFLLEILDDGPVT